MPVPAMWYMLSRPDKMPGNRHRRHASALTSSKTLTHCASLPEFLFVFQPSSGLVGGSGAKAGSLLSFT